MTRAGHVPCRGGCGVTEHRIGTAAAARCGARAQRSARSHADAGTGSYTEGDWLDTLLGIGRVVVRAARALREWWGRAGAPTTEPRRPTPVELQQRRHAIRAGLQRRDPQLRGAALEDRTRQLLTREVETYNKRAAAWHRHHAPPGTPAPTPLPDLSDLLRRGPERHSE